MTSSGIGLFELKRHGGKGSPEEPHVQVSDDKALLEEPDPVVVNRSSLLCRHILGEEPFDVLYDEAHVEYGV